MTTREAARLLGMTASRVRQLIDAGRLKATREGRDWIVDPVSVAEEIKRRKAPPGRS